jgi:hypothetical protein
MPVRWFGAWRRRRRPPEDRGDGGADAGAGGLPGGWVGPRRAEELIAATPALGQLLEALGFSPDLERRWPGMWTEIKGLVRAEIPDFAAFRAALVQVAEQLREAESASGADPMAAAWRRRGGDELLAAVVAAGDDEARVLWLLDRDPVDRVLPFVEEIPFLRGGEVTWRLPVEIPILRKRPRDPERFEELLAALEAGVGAAADRGREEARGEVLEALARLRRVLERNNAYLPSALNALQARVEDWLYRSQTAEARARRRWLEDLLDGLAAARHRFAAGRPLASSEAAAFRDVARLHAGRYADARWMQLPALTTYVLATLLASELSPFATREGSLQDSPEGVLRLVFDEVTAGRYDAEESARRLRALEARGLFVHSLVYALLRPPG